MIIPWMIKRLVAHYVEYQTKLASVKGVQSQTLQAGAAQAQIQPGQDPTLVMSM